MIEAWQVHDDPTLETVPEERWWCLVWAENARDAKLIAATVYAGDGPLFEHHFTEFFDASGVEVPDECRPAHPKVERNAVVLRLAGWSEGHELRCQCCDLAAMGMEQYAVCPDCEMCPDCGCECARQDD